MKAPDECSTSGIHVVHAFAIVVFNLDRETWQWQDIHFVLSHNERAHTNLPNYYLPTYLHTYLTIYLHTYKPTYLPTYRVPALLTYLPNHPPTCTSTKASKHAHRDKLRTHARTHARTHIRTAIPDLLCRGQLFFVLFFHLKCSWANVLVLQGKDRRLNDPLTISWIATTV